MEGIREEKNDHDFNTKNTDSLWTQVPLHIRNHKVVSKIRLWLQQKYPHVDNAAVGLHQNQMRPRTHRKARVKKAEMKQQVSQGWDRGGRTALTMGLHR